MTAAAGGAFGSLLALSAVECASRATASLVKSASGTLDRLVGRRYTPHQKQCLDEYRRLCSAHCAPYAHLEFFDFDDTSFCPRKTKDDLLEPRAELDNADAPFNLCKERRVLVRSIHRSFMALWHVQSTQLISSPEVYFVSEMRRWASDLPPEPSNDLLARLEGRLRYAIWVNRYAQRSGPIPQMAALLDAIKRLVSSCRDKARYHRWRHLLPRVHGETNSTCESIVPVLSFVSSCNRLGMDIYSCVPLADVGHSPAQCTALAAWGAPETTRSEPERGERLTNADVEDLKDINLTLERYLVLSDGLPITSISQVDRTVVTSLHEWVLALQNKLSVVGAKLHMLCSRCDALYAAQTCTRAFRLWQRSYDEVRDDFEETHVALDRALRHIADVEAILYQCEDRGAVADLKRSRSASPPCRHLRARHDSPGNRGTAEAQYLHG